MTIHMIFMSTFGVGTIVSLAAALGNYSHAEGWKCLRALTFAVFFGGMTYLNWWAQVHG